MLHNTIDISHWQTVKNYDQVKKDGIELVFHKATEGTTFTDQKYAKRKKEFCKLGSLLSILKT